jgi:hypothetical protein
VAGQGACSPLASSIIPRLKSRLKPTCHFESSDPVRVGMLDKNPSSAKSSSPPLHFVHGVRRILLSGVLWRESTALSKGLVVRVRGSAPPGHGIHRRYGRRAQIGGLPDCQETADLQFNEVAPPLDVLAMDVWSCSARCGVGTWLRERMSYHYVWHRMDGSERAIQLL